MKVKNLIARGFAAVFLLISNASMVFASGLNMDGGDIFKGKLAPVNATIKGSGSTLVAIVLVMVAVGLIVKGNIGSGILTFLCGAGIWVVGMGIIG